MHALGKPVTTMKNNLPLRYTIVTQTLHWVIACLVLAAFILGPEGSELQVYAAPHFERQLHETLGLLVFALSMLRILWRLFDQRPTFAPTSAWMTMASKAVQAALYLLLFAVPATAMAGAWLEGHPLTLLAGLNIAPWFALNHALGETLAIIHTWAADTLLYLAGLHALAAIYHHVVLKDAVLSAMLPKWIPLR